MALYANEVWIAIAAAESLRNADLPEIPLIKTITRMEAPANGLDQEYDRSGHVSSPPRKEPAWCLMQCSLQLPLGSVIALLNTLGEHGHRSCLLGDDEQISLAPVDELHAVPESVWIENFIPRGTGGFES